MCNHACPKPKRVGRLVGPRVSLKVLETEPDLALQGRLVHTPPQQLTSHRATLYHPRVHQRNEFRMVDQAAAVAVLLALPLHML
jgi:hypothetical protein